MTSETGQERIEGLSQSEMEGLFNAPESTATHFAHMEHVKSIVRLTQKQFPSLSEHEIAVVCFPDG